MKKRVIDSNAMRISFDLDEALFVSPKTHKTEAALRFPFNKIYKERLREGTIRLMDSLREKGYSIWVYTSSFRSEKYIRRLFKHYGIIFDGIINGERHLKEVQQERGDRAPSKLPSKYHISLHIDDENSVSANGKAHGFAVYKLDEPDDEWVEKIIATAEEIRVKRDMNNSKVGRKKTKNGT